MKHVSKLLILSMVFMFGASSVFAQQEIVVDNITNSVNNDTLIAGKTHTISLRVRNLVSGACNTATFNPNQGFVITSPDGASWNFSSGAFTQVFDDASATGWTSLFVNHFEDPLPGGDPGAGPNDGISPDYIGFAGVGGFAANGGLPVGFDDIGITIDIQTNLADSNLTICIDKSALGRLNTFLWAGISRGECNVVPTFNQHCMTIFDVPNIPPVCTTPTVTITGNHCDAFSQQFTATDDEGDAVTWTIDGNSPGSITPGGMWTWNAASLGDVGASITLTAIPSDSRAGTPCVVNVVVENTDPTFSVCTGNSVTAQTLQATTQQVTGADADACDVVGLTYSIVNLGGATGTASVNASGLVSFTPADPADVGAITMVVEVSDGLGTAQCTVKWNVISGAPFTAGMSDGVAVPGTFNTVDITLGAIDVNAGLGGFDLKIGFDQSALSFQRADRGQIYTDCGWEYFTYRVIDAGTVHLIGIADQNDGPNHPGCASTPYVNTLPVNLASMTFLASNNPGLNGMCVAIRYLWQDCGDNILSDAVGKAMLSSKVFDAGNTTPINDSLASLPTFLGMPKSCIPNSATIDTAQRLIDYTNGRLCFGGGGPPADRGDINVNGLPNEIADAVMFTNFFVSGLTAFAGHIPQSIAASDANADGLTLTVADLVYLIRVVVGDAPAIPKVDPVAVTYTISDNVVNVDGGAMGAAYVVIKGEVTPELLAKNMDIAFGFDGENTNVLIFSLDRNRQSFDGNFLRTNGEVLNIELATFDGAPVAAKVVPANYALAQNYPNPFNPSTVISMSLPLAGEYNLTVYNVTGQVVAEFNGASEAGEINIEWDASSLASGVYFYKMVAGEFTATKKAVLLK